MVAVDLGQTQIEKDQIQSDGDEIYHLAKQYLFDATRGDLDTSKALVDAARTVINEHEEKKVALDQPISKNQPVCKLQEMTGKLPFKKKCRGDLITVQVVDHYSQQQNFLLV